MTLSLGYKLSSEEQSPGDLVRYAQMAEKNRVRSIPIIAPRGSMLDREGRVLIDNYPSFSVLLLRDSPLQAAAAG